MNSDAQISLLSSADVQRRFNNAASHFDDAAFVHGVTRDGMLERLQPMHIEASTIVDLGCATGLSGQALARRFRRAHILSIDLSSQMLREAGRNKPWFTKLSAIQADAVHLPLADQSVDIVFANLLLPWIGDLAEMFNDISRVLRHDGLFVFSTLGPDSLLVLRRAWQQADGEGHVNPFIDMHDIGDAAVRAGLRDPVLDVDRLAVTYANSRDLFADLTATGARNCLRHRRRTLIGKRRFGIMVDALNAAKQDGVIRLELELVYGHCWGSGPHARGGEVRVDASQIARRK